MTRTLATIGVALSIVMAVPAVGNAAGVDGLFQKAQAPAVVHQRQDVREISVPPPPYGPATPSPFCSPASPYC